MFSLLRRADNVLCEMLAALEGLWSLAPEKEFPYAISTTGITERSTACVKVVIIKHTKGE